MSVAQPALIEAVLLARDFYDFAGPPPPPPVPVLSFLVPKIIEYASRGGYLPEAHSIRIGRDGQWGNEAPQMYSALLRQGHRSTILLHKKLNRCHRRLGIGIELGNLLLGVTDESYTTMDIMTLLSSMRSGLSPAPHTAAHAEQVAVNFGVELLVPMIVTPIMERLLLDKADRNAIADQFLIPKNIAEHLILGGWRQRVELHRDLPRVQPQPTR